jgi:CSLREA domain-containing protein
MPPVDQDRLTKQMFKYSDLPVIRRVIMKKRNLLTSFSQQLVLVLMAVTLVGAVISAWSVQAGKASTTIRVTSFSDSLNTDGACTLREAIIAANKDVASGSGPGECPAGSGDDTIILPAGTYTLTRSDNGKEDSSSTGDLDIRSNILFITEGGQVTITSSSSFRDRIFHILSGNVSISGVVLSGGKPAGDGGGIFNLATLTLDRSTLSSNFSGGRGGAIYNAGTLNLTNVTVSGNTSKIGGGGLFILGAMPV